METRDFAGYGVVRPLATGGMTRLLLALDAKQNHVVIRHLREEYARRGRFRRQFLHGAKVIKHLNHPYISRLLKLGYTGDLPYMVLEYIEAKTLREMLVTRDPLLTHNTLSFMRQLATLLGYVHSAGYLHLDFKPENLLVRQDGMIFLIDFDLARPIRRSWWNRRLRDLPGTPAYVAPETLTQRTVDVRSDIYSLGVVFFEMLTFHKPYERDRIEETLAAQRSPNVQPAGVRQYMPKVAPGLEQLVMKCLAKRPADRYPSVNLIIRDLEAIL